MDFKTFALLFGIVANLFCAAVIWHNRRVMLAQQRVIESQERTIRTQRQAKAELREVADACKELTDWRTRVLMAPKEN